MERQIKDYLPLYIGCDVFYHQINERGHLDARTYKDLVDHEHLVKPILRHLSDLKEEELLELLTICYRSVYDTDPSFEEIVMASDSDGGGLKASEGKWDYGLTVSKDGVLFSANGSFLSYPVFEITRKLLSWKYDIFGLIEAGLAVEKSELIKPV